MASISNTEEKYSTKSDKEVRDLYESWLGEHGKVYNDVGEKERRFEIFKDNLKFIEEHNAGNHSYKVGLNQFSDLTKEEFSEMLGFNSN